MILIGLGNPGKNFDNTPHNVGFAVIDKLAEKNNFSAFEPNKKSESLISAGIIGDVKIILVKPQTFMNESGKTAKKLLDHNKNQEIVVIHDDIDLELGKMKILKNRGSAGHKGVESIVRTIGNKNLTRIRIGVSPKNLKPTETKDFVLRKFNKNERDTLTKIIDRAILALEKLIRDGLEKTMNEFN